MIVGDRVVESGQRRIPVQFAKRVVGRRMYGGQSTYIPLKVNQSGVIPVIFASSILAFPALIAHGAANWDGAKKLVNDNLVGNRHAAGSTSGLYALLILFFAYFYTAIAFNPAQQADIIRKQGGFIPGIRPGPPTEQYLAKVLNRITLPGALFLVVDRADARCSCSKFWDITQFPFGGTALLITVGVALETMKQIDSQLMMRNYEGLPLLSGPRMSRRRDWCCWASRVPARARRARGCRRALRHPAPLDRRAVPRLGRGRAPRRARGEGVHGRRRARPRRDRRGRGRGAPRTRRRSQTASCSTASRARCTRPRSSTGSSAAPPRPGDQPRGPADIVLDRSRPAGVRELPARVPRQHAADRRLDVRHVRRPGRAPRRRHRGVDRPSPRALRPGDGADHRLLPRRGHARRGRRRGRRRRRVRAAREGRSTRSPRRTESPEVATDGHCRKPPPRSR